MDKPRLRVLLIDDDEDDHLLVRDLLGEISQTRFDLDWAATYEAGLAAIQHGEYAACLLDYRLGPRSGLELLRELSRAETRFCPVILLTAFGGYELDVEAMKSGAADFLVKNQITAELLERVVRYAVERQCSAEMARHSEEQYRSLIENMTETVFRMRSDSRFTFVSRHGEELTGYPREQLLAMSLRDLVRPEDRPALAKWLARVVNEKTTEPFETMIASSRGGVQVEIRASALFTGAGGIDAIQGTLRDLTQEVLLERQLRQAQKMEALGTLAGGIAHDFKNLLIPITLQTELALNDADLKSSTRQCLEQVLKSGHNADNLIRRILTFSRSSPEGRKPVEMGLLLDDTLKLIRPLVPKNVEIHQNLAVPPGWDTVLADAGQIQQVIMNLCTNAVQAMGSSGGLLELTLACVAVGSSGTKPLPLGLAPGSYVRVTVRDTGQGIEETVMDKIFDPFFTTKATGEGTGLGLAVVYGIVKQHGGGIAVASQPGQGTVFDLYLPRIQSIASPQGVEPKVPAAIPRGSERILFVDDEPTVCEAVRDILTYLGYRVVLAAGGPEALGVFESDPEGFDLIITDHAMPAMIGIELARALSRLRPGIPIILCTAFQGITTAEADAAGVRELIAKPVALADLARSIRRVLDEG